MRRQEKEFDDSYMRIDRHTNTHTCNIHIIHIIHIIYIIHTVYIIHIIHIIHTHHRWTNQVRPAKKPKTKFCATFPPTHFRKSKT